MASLSTKTGRSSFAVMHWKTPSWQNTTFHFCDLRPTAAESRSGLFMPCCRRKEVELWNTQKQKLENHAARINANLFWTQKFLFFTCIFFAKITQPLERYFNNYYFIIQGGCVRFPKTPCVCTGSETAEGSLSVSSSHSKFSVSRLACDIIRRPCMQRQWTSHRTTKSKRKRSLLFLFMAISFHKQSGGADVI